MNTNLLSQLLVVYGLQNTRGWRGGDGGTLSQSITQVRTSGGSLVCGHDDHLSGKL
jgi:hypothetical protein